MAQKKRKHGKVESRKAKPFIRFKLGVLLLLIAVSFVGCFALYMISATSDPDFWDREIVGSTEATDTTSNSDGIPVEIIPDSAAAVVNPVPESERADDVHLALCAWVGEVSEFTNYHQTASEMVFPDAVSGLSDSARRSLVRDIIKSKPYAVYLWQQTPCEITNVRAFLESLREKQPDVPVYILSALPVEDASENRRISGWNAELFALADEMGLHYVDVSTKCKKNDGTLAAEFTDEDVLYAMVGEEILMHIAD